MLLPGLDGSRKLTKEEKEAKKRDDSWHEAIFNQVVENIMKQSKTLKSRNGGKELSK